MSEPLHREKFNYVRLCLHCLSIKNQRKATYTMATTISQQASFPCQFKSFCVISYKFSLLFFSIRLMEFQILYIVLTLIYSISPTL